MARISKEKKEEIRSNILEYAAKRFFEKGYEKTSTKEIAKQVDIAEGTLFNYFSTKADLYMEVFAEEFQMNEKELIEPNFTENVADQILSEYVHKLYSPILKIPKFMLMEMVQVFFTIGKKNFSKIEKLAKLDFKYMEMTKELAEKMQKQGLLIEEMDAKLLSDTIYSAVFFEFTLYVYYEQMTKDELVKNIREKITFICKGYLS